MELPDSSFERAAIDRGYTSCAGVDEVGRGPLAGPVFAVAVLWSPHLDDIGLNDSKKLSAKRRDALAGFVMENCVWAEGRASVEEIDRINIFQASHLAMRRALEKLAHAPDFALIDGKHLPKGLRCDAEAVVKGDARCVSISAAAVVAKMLRDQHMVDLAQHYPQYGWDRNAGYPTAMHRQALLDFGVTPEHRRSFKPVHNILCRG